MTVAIITDSTACIPPELAVRYGIEVVPLHLIFGGRTFVDTITADTSEFYELLRTAPDLPTTAAPSPGMFLNAIARARLTGESVLCITVSKQFSAMYDSARQAIELAKAETPNLDVRLFDSRNAAMAQGFVALEAARAARLPGATIDDVLARADEMAGQVELLVGYATAAVDPSPAGATSTIVVDDRLAPGLGALLTQALHDRLAAARHVA